VEAINEKFVEARDEIEYAQEDAGEELTAIFMRAGSVICSALVGAPDPASPLALCAAETVYFNESADAARKAVGEVLDAYGQLCAKLRCSRMGPRAFAIQRCACSAARLAC
jgi:hypothetical protein